MADLAAERFRIARELHDGIAQDLAAIGYSLDAEIGRSDTHPESRAALRQLREELTTLNARMREEIFRLRQSEPVNPQENLVNELQLMPLDFRIDGELQPDSKGEAIGKCLLELARNAFHHGEATELAIDILSHQISFHSNGHTSTVKTQAGFGLQGVVERLDEIGWSLESSDDFTEIRLVELQ